MSVWKTIKAGLFGAGPKVQSTDLQQAELDPASKSILERQAAEGGISAEEIANRELQGTTEAAGQTMADLSQKMGFLKAAQGGPQDPALNEAIARKYNRATEMDLNELQRRTRLSAQYKRGERLNQRSQLFYNEANYKMGINKAQIRVAENKAAAKAAVIRSIVGVIGAGAGAMVGGGAGAQAGHQIGSGSVGGGDVQKIG
jgi:hypothetical protein